MVRRTCVDEHIVTAGRYAGPAALNATSPPDGTLDQRRWRYHRRRTVRRTGVDGCIITAKRYAGLASIFAYHHRTGVEGHIFTARPYAGPVPKDTSSPPDGTPIQCRWMHHHRGTVRRAGVERHIVTIRWYAGPTVVRYHHRCMVRQSDGGKMPSLLAHYWRR
jgi:hypothetical protein